jgi:predicted nucleic-acid-binding protein
LFQRAQQQTQNPLENKPNFLSIFQQGSNRNQSPLVDQKQLDQPLDDKQKPNTRYQEKLESHSENIFQSIYLELVQDLANEFLFKQNQIANEQIKDLIEKTIYIELREISEQAIAQYRLIFSDFIQKK